MYVKNFLKNDMIERDGRPFGQNYRAISYARTNYIHIKATHLNRIHITTRKVVMSKKN